MPGVLSASPYQASATTVLPPDNTRKLPSISSALENPLQPALENPHSTFPKLDHISRLPPRSYSPPGGSLKRPRLSYEQSHGSEPVNADHQISVDIPDRDGSGSRLPDLLAYEKRQDDLGRKPSPECANCFNLRDLVQNVISGLIGLDTELRQALTGVPPGRSSKQENDALANTNDVGDIGLRQSLMWAANSVDSSTRLVRDLAISRSLATMAVTTPGSTPRHDQSSISSVPADVTKRRFDVTEKERYEDGKRICPPTSVDDPLPRGSDTSSSAVMAGDGQRRSYMPDQQPPAPAQSPHRTLSSSGSLFGASQSPMQIPPSARMLPSPSSLRFPATSTSLPPMSSSPGPTQSAHAAHLQDLQHQISTQKLALGTLQREHDTLLAAFSRQQTRCSTLDKKSQVSDNEINTLTEEKIRLQSQVEALETQVEELIKSRDEAHKQSVANGAQYMQIMAMSSRLQAQGAADMKRWKGEKEEWEKEKEDYKKRIQELDTQHSPGGQSRERDGPTQSHAADASESTQQSSSVSSDDVLKSTSLDTLRAEMIRLRRNYRDMENTLRDLQSETSRIDQVMQDFADIRRRITSKAENSLQQRENEVEVRPDHAEDVAHTS